MSSGATRDTLATYWDIIGTFLNAVAPKDTSSNLKHK